jgi:rubrerythrin
MKSLKIYFIIILSFVLAVACANNDSKETVQNSEVNDNMKMNEHSISEAESELVREGKIDLESIDKNNDGNVYECPMDWNVLADEYHDCPVCGMKMKEYTLNQAKENLIKYGYEVKE